MKPGGLCSPSDGSSTPSGDEIASGTCKSLESGSQFSDASTSEESPACLTPDLCEERPQGVRPNCSIANGFVSNDVTNGVCESSFSPKKAIDIPRHVLSPPSSEDGEERGPLLRTASQGSSKSTLYQGRSEVVKAPETSILNPTDTAKSLPLEVLRKSCEPSPAGASEQLSSSVYNIFSNRGAVVADTGDSNKVSSKTEHHLLPKNYKSPKYRRKCSLEEMVAKLHHRTDVVPCGINVLEGFPHVGTVYESNNPKETANCFHPTKVLDEQSSCRNEHSQSKLCDKPNTATCDAHPSKESSSIMDIQENYDSKELVKLCDTSCESKSSVSEMCDKVTENVGHASEKHVFSNEKSSEIDSSNIGQSGVSEKHFSACSNLKDDRSLRTSESVDAISEKAELINKSEGSMCSLVAITEVSKDAQNTSVPVDSVRTSSDKVHITKGSKFESASTSGTSSTTYESRSVDKISLASHLYQTSGIGEKEKIVDLTCDLESVRSSSIDLIDDETRDSGSDLEILFEKRENSSINKVLPMVSTDADSIEHIGTNCNSKRHSKNSGEVGKSDIQPTYLNSGNGNVQYLEPISDDENSLLCAPSPPSDFSSVSGIQSNSNTPLFSDTPSDASRGAIMVKISDAVAAILSDVSDDSLPPSPLASDSQNTFTNILPSFTGTDGSFRHTSEMQVSSMVDKDSDKYCLDETNKDSCDKHATSDALDYTISSDAIVFDDESRELSENKISKLVTADCPLRRSLESPEKVDLDPCSSSTGEIVRNSSSKDGECVAAEFANISLKVGLSHPKLEKQIGLPPPSNSEVTADSSCGSSGSPVLDKVDLSLLQSKSSSSEPIVCSLQGIASITSSSTCSTNSLCQNPTSGTLNMSSQEIICNTLSRESGKNGSGLDCEYGKSRSDVSLPLAELSLTGPSTEGKELALFSSECSYLLTVPSTENRKELTVNTECVDNDKKNSISVEITPCSKETFIKTTPVVKVNPKATIFSASDKSKPSSVEGFSTTGSDVSSNVSFEEFSNIESRCESLKNLKHSLPVECMLASCSTDPASTCKLILGDSHSESNLSFSKGSSKNNQASSVVSDDNSAMVDLTSNKENTPVEILSNVNSSPSLKTIRVSNTPPRALSNVSELLYTATVSDLHNDNLPYIDPIISGAGGSVMNQATCISSQPEPDLSYHKDTCPLNVNSKDVPTFEDQVSDNPVNDKNCDSKEDSASDASCNNFFTRLENKLLSLKAANSKVTEERSHLQKTDVGDGSLADSLVNKDKSPGDLSEKYCSKPARKLPVLATSMSEDVQPLTSLLNLGPLEDLVNETTQTEPRASTFEKSESHSSVSKESKVPLSVIEDCPMTHSVISGAQKSTFAAVTKEDDPPVSTIDDCGLSKVTPLENKVLPTTTSEDNQAVSAVISDMTKASTELDCSDNKLSDLVSKENIPTSFLKDIESDESLDVETTESQSWSLKTFIGNSQLSHTNQTKDFQPSSTRILANQAPSGNQNNHPSTDGKAKDVQLSLPGKGKETPPSGLCSIKKNLPPRLQSPLENELSVLDVTTNEKSKPLLYDLVVDCHQPGMSRTEISQPLVDKSEKINSCSSSATDSMEMNQPSVIGNVEKSQSSGTDSVETTQLSVMNQMEGGNLDSKKIVKSVSLNINKENDEPSDQENVEKSQSSNMDNIEGSPLLDINSIKMKEHKYVDCSARIQPSDMRNIDRIQHSSDSIDRSQALDMEHSKRSKQTTLIMDDVENSQTSDMECLEYNHLQMAVDTSLRSQSASVIDEQESECDNTINHQSPSIVEVQTRQQPLLKNTQESQLLVFGNKSEDIDSPFMSNNKTSPLPGVNVEDSHLPVINREDSQLLLLNSKDCQLQSIRAQECQLSIGSFTEDSWAGERQSPVVNIEDSQSPVINTEVSQLSVIDTEDSQSPVVNTEVSQLSVIDTENSQSPVVNTEDSQSQVVSTEDCQTLILNTEDSQSQIINKDSQTPVVNTEDGQSPVVNIEDSQSLVVNTEYSQSPVVNTEDSQSPVVNIEDSQSPVVNTEDSQSSVVNTEDSQSPVVNIEDSQSPVVNIEDSQSPVVNTEDSQSPVVNTEDSQSSVVNTEDSQSSVVNTEDSQSSVVNTEDSQSSVVNTEDSQSPVVNIEDSQSPVVNIEDSQSPVVNTEGRQSPVVNSEDTQIPVVNSENSQSLIVSREDGQTPVVNAANIQLTEDGQTPVVNTENIQLTEDGQTPVVNTENIQLTEDGQTPVVNTENIQLEVENTENIQLPVVNTKSIPSPVVNTGDSQSQIENTEDIQSLIEITEDRQSSVEKAEGRQSSVEKAEGSQSSVEKAEGSQSSVGNIESIQSPFKNSKGSQSPIESTESIQSLVENTEGSQLPVENTKVSQSPVENTESIQSPVESTEGSQSPVDAKGSQSPVANTEGILLPIENTKVSRSPVENTEGSQLPVENTESIQSTVENTEGSQSPVENTEGGQSPVANTESIQSLVENTEGSQSPVANPEGSQLPVENTKVSQSLVENTEGSQSPVENTEGSQSPVANTESIQSPVANTESIQSPVENTEGSQSPVENTENIQSPVENTEGIQSPVENNESQSPVENTKGIQSPVENTQGIQSPVENTQGIQSPVENTKGSQSPVENTKSSQLPVENTKSIQSPVENTKSIQSPVENTKSRQSPVENTEGIQSPGESPDDNCSLVTSTEASHLTVANIEVSQSPVDNTQDNHSSVTNIEGRHSLVCRSAVENSEVIHSPVAGTEVSHSSVENIEANQSPVVDTDCSQSPIESAEVSHSSLTDSNDTQSPIVNTDVSHSSLQDIKDGQSLVINTEVSQSPVENTNVSQSLVTNTEDCHSPVDIEDIQSPVKNIDGCQSPVEDTEVRNSPVESTKVSHSTVTSTKVSHSPAEKIEGCQSPVEDTEVRDLPVENNDVQAPVEGTEISQLLVEDTADNDSTVANAEIRYLLVKSTKDSQSPVERTEVQESLVEKTKDSQSSFVNTENGNSPVVKSENSPALFSETVDSRSPVNTVGVTNSEDSRSPVVNAEDSHSAVVNAEDIHSPVVNAEDIHSPVVNAEDSHSPVVNAEDIHSPVVNAEDIHSPVVNAEDIHSPVVNAEDSYSPVAEDSHSPVVNAEDSRSPVAEDSHSPVAEDSHSPIVNAEDSHSPIVNAEDSHSSVAEDSHSPVAEDSHSPVAEDIHSPVVNAEDSHSPVVNAEDSHSPVVNAEDSHSPILNAEDSHSPVAEDSHSPIVNAEDSHSPVAEDSHSPIVNAEDSHSPVVNDEDSHSSGAEDSHSPVAEDSHSSVAEDSHSPVAEDSHSPVVNAEGSHSPVVNAEGSHSPVVNYEDSHSSVAEDSHSPVAEDSHSPVAEDSHSPVAEDSHSTVAEDSPSPVAEDSPSPIVNAEDSHSPIVNAEDSHSPVVNDEEDSHSPVADAEEDSPSPVANAEDSHSPVKDSHSPVVNAEDGHSPVVNAEEDSHSLVANAEDSYSPVINAVESYSPVMNAVDSHSPVISAEDSRSPVVNAKESHSPVANEDSYSPVINAEGSHSSVINAEDHQLPVVNAKDSHSSVTDAEDSHSSVVNADHHQLPVINTKANQLPLENIEVGLPPVASMEDNQSPVMKIVDSHLSDVSNTKDRQLIINKSENRPTPIVEEVNIVEVPALNKQASDVATNECRQLQTLNSMNENRLSTLDDAELINSTNAIVSYDCQQPSAVGGIGSSQQPALASIEESSLQVASSIENPKSILGTDSISNNKSHVVETESLANNTLPLAINNIEGSNLSGSIDRNLLPSAVIAGESLVLDEDKSEETQVSSKDSVTSQLPSAVDIAESQKSTTDTINDHPVTSNNSVNMIPYANKEEGENIPALHKENKCSFSEAEASSSLVDKNILECAEAKSVSFDKCDSLSSIDLQEIQPQAVNANGDGVVSGVDAREESHNKCSRPSGAKNIEGSPIPEVNIENNVPLSAAIEGNFSPVLDIEDCQSSSIDHCDDNQLLLMDSNKNNKQLVADICENTPSSISISKLSSEEVFKDDQLPEGDIVEGCQKGIGKGEWESSAEDRVQSSPHECINDSPSSPVADHPVGDSGAREIISLCVLNFEKLNPSSPVTTQSSTTMIEAVCIDKMPVQIKEMTTNCSPLTTDSHKECCLLEASGDESSCSLTQREGIVSSAVAESESPHSNPIIACSGDNDSPVNVSIESNFSPAAETSERSPSLSTGTDNCSHHTDSVTENDSLHMKNEEDSQSKEANMAEKKCQLGDNVISGDTYGASACISPSLASKSSGPPILEGSNCEIGNLVASDVMEDLPLMSKGASKESPKPKSKESPKPKEAVLKVVELQTTSNNDEDQIRTNKAFEVCTKELPVTNAIPLPCSQNLHPLSSSKGTVDASVSSETASSLDEKHLEAAESVLEKSFSPTRVSHEMRMASVESSGAPATSADDHSLAVDDSIKVKHPYDSDETIHSVVVTEDNHSGTATTCGVDIDSASDINESSPVSAVPTSDEDLEGNKQSASDINESSPVSAVPTSDEDREGNKQSASDINESSPVSAVPTSDEDLEGNKQSASDINESSPVSAVPTSDEDLEGKKQSASDINESSPVSAVPTGDDDLEGNKPSVSGFCEERHSREVVCATPSSTSGVGSERISEPCSLIEGKKEESQSLYCITEHSTVVAANKESAVTENSHKNISSLSIMHQEITFEEKKMEAEGLCESSSKEVFNEVTEISKVEKGVTNEGEKRVTSEDKRVMNEGEKRVTSEDKRVMNEGEKGVTSEGENRVTSEGEQSVSSETSKATETPGKTLLNQEIKESSGSEVKGGDENNMDVKIIEVKKEICFSSDESLSCSEDFGSNLYNGVTDSVSACTYNVNERVVTLVDDKIEPEGNEPEVGGYPCPLCQEMLTEPLEEHVIEHHVCVSFIPAKTTLSYHYHMLQRVDETADVSYCLNEQKRAYVCRSCQFASKDMNAVRFHLNIHEDVFQVRTGNGTCMCNRKVYSYQFHKWKSLIHSSTYYCEICNYYFACEKGLVNHKTAIHYSQNHCEICNSEVLPDDIIIHTCVRKNEKSVDESETLVSDTQITTRSKGSYGISWNIYDNSLNYLDGKYFRLGVASKVTDTKLDRSYLKLPLRNVLEEAIVPEKVKLDPAKDIRKYLQGKRDIKANEEEINEVLKNFSWLVQMEMEKKVGHKKWRSPTHGNRARRENDLFGVLGIRTLRSKGSPRKERNFSKHLGKSSKKKADVKEEEPFFNELKTEALGLTRTRSGMQLSKDEFDADEKIGSRNFILEMNVVVAGEWSKDHTYICCSCGTGYLDLADIMDHKWEFHPSVWCAHTMFQGQGSVPLSFCKQFQPPTERPQRLSLPPVPAVPLREAAAQSKLTSQTDDASDTQEKKSRMTCSRCSLTFPEIEVFHSHLVDCGGLNQVTVVKKKAKKGFRFKRRKGQGVPNNRYGICSLPSTPLKPRFGDRSSGLNTPLVDKSNLSLIHSSGVKRRLELAVGSINNDELKNRLKAIITSAKSSSGNMLSLPSRRTIRMKLRKKALDTRKLRKTRHSDKAKEEANKTQKGNAKEVEIDSQMPSKNIIPQKGNVVEDKLKDTLNQQSGVEAKDKIQKSAARVYGGKKGESESSINAESVVTTSTTTDVASDSKITKKKKSKTQQNLQVTKKLQAERKVNGFINVSKRKTPNPSSSNVIKSVESSAGVSKTVDVKKVLAKKILSKKKIIPNVNVASVSDNKLSVVVDSVSLVGNKEISVQKRTKQSGKSKSNKIIQNKVREVIKGTFETKPKSKKPKALNLLQNKKNIVKSKLGIGKVSNISSVVTKDKAPKPKLSKKTPQTLSLGKVTEPIKSAGKLTEMAKPIGKVSRPVKKSIPNKRRDSISSQSKVLQEDKLSNLTSGKVKGLPKVTEKSNETATVSAPSSVKSNRYLESSSSEVSNEDSEDSEPEVIRNFRSGRGCTGRMGLRNKRRPMLSRYSFRTCPKPAKKEVDVEEKAEEELDNQELSKKPTTIVDDQENYIMNPDKEGEPSDYSPLQKRKKRKKGKYESQDDDWSYVPYEYSSESDDEYLGGRFTQPKARRVPRRKKRRVRLHSKTLYKQENVLEEEAIYAESIPQQNETSVSLQVPSTGQNEAKPSKRRNCGNVLKKPEVFAKGSQININKKRVRTVKPKTDDSTILVENPGVRTVQEADLKEINKSDGLDQKVSKTKGRKQKSRVSAAQNSELASSGNVNETVRDYIKKRGIRTIDSSAAQDMSKTKASKTRPIKTQIGVTVDSKQSTQDVKKKLSAKKTVRQLKTKQDIPLKSQFQKTTNKSQDLLTRIKDIGKVPRKVKERSSSISLGNLARSEVTKKGMKNIKKCSSMSDIPKDLSKEAETQKNKRSSIPQFLNASDITSVNENEKSKDFLVDANVPNLVAQVGHVTETQVKGKRQVGMMQNITKGNQGKRSQVRKSSKVSVLCSKEETISKNIPKHTSNVGAAKVLESGMPSLLSIIEKKIIAQGGGVQKTKAKREIKKPKQVTVVAKKKLLKSCHLETSENKVESVKKPKRRRKTGESVPVKGVASSSLELEELSECRSDSLTNQPASVSPEDDLSQSQVETMNRNTKKTRKRKIPDELIPVVAESSISDECKRKKNVVIMKENTTDEIETTLSNNDNSILVSEVVDVNEGTKKSRKRKLPVKSLTATGLDSVVNHNAEPTGIFIPSKRPKKVQSKGTSKLTKMVKTGKMAKCNTVIDNHIVKKRIGTKSEGKFKPQSVVPRKRVPNAKGKNPRPKFDSMPVLEPVNAISKRPDFISSENSKEDDAEIYIAARIKRRRSSVEKVKEIPTRSSATVNTQESPSPPQLQAFIDEISLNQGLGIPPEENSSTHARSSKAKNPGIRKRRTQSSYEITVKEDLEGNLGQSKSTGSVGKGNRETQGSGNITVVKKATERKRAASTSGVPKKDDHDNLIDLPEPNKIAVVKQKEDNTVLDKTKKQKGSRKKRKAPSVSKKEINDLKCLDCGLRFDSFASLEDHKQDCITIALEMSLMEAEDHLFECQHCHLTFALKGTQRQHTASCRLTKNKRSVHKHDGKVRRRTSGRSSNSQGADVSAAKPDVGMSFPAAGQATEQESNEKLGVDACPSTSPADKNTSHFTSKVPEKLSSNKSDLRQPQGSLRKDHAQETVPAFAESSRVDHVGEKNSPSSKGSPRSRKRSRANGKVEHCDVIEPMSSSIASEQKCVVCGCEIKDEDMSNKHLLLEQFAHCCQQQPVLEVCVLLAYYNLGIESVRSLVASAIFYQGSTILKLDAKLQTTPDLDPCLSNTENKSASQLMQILASPHCMWVSSVLEAVAQHYYSAEAVSISGTRQEAQNAITVLEELFKDIANVDGTIRKNQMLRTMKETFEAGTL